MEMEMTNIERALMTNDLSALSVEERGEYYKSVCESLGLNPLTQPFGYIELAADGGGKKLTLYCKRDAADQLRRIHGVSIKIKNREVFNDLLLVTAEATDKTGRVDEAIAAISLKKHEVAWDNGLKKMKRTGQIVSLEGEALANAYMKAETKAKRRVTLSICGLGWLDETEVPYVAEQADSTIAENLMPQKAAVVKPKKVEVLPADEVGPFYYDLSKLPEDKKSAAFEYLESAGATICDDNGFWKSDKPLKKLVSCNVKIA
jgi:hypothetical protein